MWALEEAALVRAGLGRLLGRRGLAGLERMRLSGMAWAAAGMRDLDCGGQHNRARHTLLLAAPLHARRSMWAALIFARAISAHRVQY
jgi:hypothetical protein